MAQVPFEQICLLGSRERLISPFIKSEQLVLRNIEFLLKTDDAIEYPFTNDLFFGESAAVVCESQDTQTAK